MPSKEKRLLNRLHSMPPEIFNDYEFDEKFSYFKAVVNEYIKKVALPKQWPFTKTIKHWPDGTGEDEGITEDGHVFFSLEKKKLLQDVLEYPDLGIFALENYGLFFNSRDAEENKEKGTPAGWALSLKKVSKQEALSFCNAFRKHFQEYQDNKPNTEKWDEAESLGDRILDDIEKFYELTRPEQIGIGTYVLLKFAEKKGIPTPEVNRTMDTNPDKTINEVVCVVNEVERYKKEFWEFAFVNYGLSIHFIGKDRISTVKIPDEMIEMHSEMLRNSSNGKLTKEQVKQLQDKFNELTGVG